MRLRSARTQLVDTTGRDLPVGNIRHGAVSRHHKMQSQNEPFRIYLVRIQNRHTGRVTQPFLARKSDRQAETPHNSAPACFTVRSPHV